MASTAVGKSEMGPVLLPEPNREPAAFQMVLSGSEPGKMFLSFFRCASRFNKSSEVESLKRFRQISAHFF